MRKKILVNIAHYCAIRSEKLSKGDKWGAKPVVVFDSRRQSVARPTEGCGSTLPVVGECTNFVAWSF